MTTPSDRPDIRDQQIVALRTVLQSLLVASLNSDKNTLSTAQKRAKMALGITQ